MRFLRDLVGAALLACCMSFILPAQQVLRESAIRRGGSGPKATSNAPAAAVNSQTPQAFFERARKLSDPRAAGVPFHLKARFAANTAAGEFGDAEFGGQGTVELWWASENLWRRESTLGRYRLVVLKNGDSVQRYATSNYAPLRLRQADRAVLVRLPSNTGTSSDWNVKQAEIGGINLSRVSTQYLAGAKAALVPLEYYFAADGVLRITRNGDLLHFYNGFEGFDGYSIPRSVELAIGSSRLLTVSVETLEPFAQNHQAISILTAIPDGLSPAGPIIRSSTASRLVRVRVPVHPPAAATRTVQGVVVVDATIDASGAVHEPYVLWSANPVLNASALHEVQKRKFDPAATDGSPVSVDTAIAVEFYPWIESAVPGTLTRSRY